MCAINGFNWNDQGLIDLMNKATLHRGPDGTRVFLGEDLSFGHNRLSIIDTRSIADQPMESDDGRFVIVFNGEIYNFLDLRKKLEDSYHFKTKGDTEVILAAYKKWGKNCLNMLNGMFAFAIWDKIERSLFLARDPMGIKPLYYYWNDEKFIFSSEIKAILEHPIPRVLDRFAFSCYMKILYTPGPYTMFDGIKKLSPGSFAYLRDKKLTISSYVKSTDKFGGHNHCDKIVLSQIISKAITGQLVSDRPLGIYLSGGMDSTTILDVVSKNTNKIKTFSVGFELDDIEQSEKFNKDMLLARKTAELYKTDHHEILVKKDEIIPLLEDAIYYLDEPISNATVVPMLKLAKYAKQSVAVVLGGDGGDELFGGYERYRLSLFSDYYQKIPLFIRTTLNRFKIFSELNTKKGFNQFKLFMFQKESVLNKVLGSDYNNSQYNDSIESFFKNYLFSTDEDFSGPELLMNADQKSWLIDESLMRSDKMSMAGGLEMRVPFLDLELVKYSKTISYKDKIGFTNTKKVLRKLMKGNIPDFIINQPKRGWFSPGSKWLRDPNIIEFTKDILEPDYYPIVADLFNWSEIRSMLDRHISKKAYYFNTIWSILIFQIWAKKYQIRLK